MNYKNTNKKNGKEKKKRMRRKSFKNIAKKG